MKNQEDGAMSKVIAAQAQEPRFTPKDPCKLPKQCMSVPMERGEVETGEPWKLMVNRVEGED